jgi:hypothetical protein
MLTIATVLRELGTLSRVKDAEPADLEGGRGRPRMTNETPETERLFEPRATIC